MSRNEIKEFYKRYFLDYWEIKYIFLKNQFEKYISEKNPPKIEELDYIQYLEKKIPTYLKYEIHFLKFQIIEALFSLMFALEEGDNVNLWFNLSFTKDFNRRSFKVYDKIAQLRDFYSMKRYLEQEIQFEEKSLPLWKFFFFLTIKDKKKNWELIKDNLILLLVQLASQFNERKEYNAYKHGLRCYRSLLDLTFQSKYTKKTLSAKDGMHFLTTKEEDGNTKVDIMFKAFSPKEDLYFIEYTYKLIRNIIIFRKAYFFNTPIANIAYFEMIEKRRPIENDLITMSRSITSTDALYQLGVEAYQEGDLNKAIFCYEKILQINENHYDSIFQLGYIYFITENYKKAIDYFRRYEKNSQGEFWGECIYNLALSHYYNGEIKEAKKNLLKILEKNIENQQITVEARYLVVRINLELNQNYFEKYQKNKSNYINKAEKHLLKAGEVKFKFPNLWIKVASIRYYLDDLEKAKALLLRVLENESENYHVLSKLIDVSNALEEYESMQKYIQRALQLNEKDAHVWLMQGILMRKQDNKEREFEAFQKVLLYSKNAEQEKLAYHHLGVYYLRIKDFEFALEHFNKVLKVDNSFQASIIGYIQTLWESENFDSIIEFTQNMEISQKNIHHLAMRAQTFAKKGELEDALNLIDTLIEFSKDDHKTLIDLFEYKGNIYKDKGDKKSAIKFYKKALEKANDGYSYKDEIKDKIKQCKEE